jgi:hypothetical protein
MARFIRERVSRDAELADRMIALRNAPGRP